MNHFLDFSFLAILNLFIVLLWPVSGYYAGTRPAPPEGTTRRDVLGIIVLILTVLAVLADIFFLVLRLAAH